MDIKIQPPQRNYKCDLYIDIKDYFQQSLLTSAKEIRYKHPIVHLYPGLSDLHQLSNDVTNPKSEASAHMQKIT